MLDGNHALLYFGANSRHLLEARRISICQDGQVARHPQKYAGLKKKNGYTWVNMGSLAMRINMVCVYHKVFSAVNYWLPRT